MANSFNKAFFFIYLLLIANSAFADNKFVKRQVDIKAPILNLQNVNNQLGYFTVKNKIYKIHNNYIVHFEYQPPVDNIYLFKAFGENHFWVLEYDYSYTTIIWEYKNAEWKKLNHPFSNHILDLYLCEEGLLYAAGDRELYLYKNKRWESITYPETPFALLKIISFDNSVFAIGANGKIYKLTNLKWSEIGVSAFITDAKTNGDELYFYNLESIYKFNSEGIFKIIDQLGNNITSVAISTGGKLYFTTEKNQLMCLNEQKIDTLFIADSKLQNLAVYQDKIIISSVGGVFYTNFNSIISEKNIKSFPGFSEIGISLTSREVFDEYGIAIADFNNDGSEDIYAVCINEPNRLYIRTESISPIYYYNEEAMERNVAGFNKYGSQTYNRELYLGVGAADIDNDGDTDLYLCNLLGANRLYLNDGKGYFRDVSFQSNRACENNARSNSSSFADVDKDGDLDLFVTNEYSSNKLYRNNGYGYFEDITESAGLTSIWGGMNSSFSDIDNDGDQDLCVVGWGVSTKVYLNESTSGKIIFTDISDGCGIKTNTDKKSNGIVFADINNDSYPDLFISNRKSSNELYLNDSKGKFNLVTEEMGLTDDDLSMGVLFADFDHDGFKDLFVSNIGSSKLYKNIDGKNFTDETYSSGLRAKGYGTGCAAFDYDNDGDFDFYSAYYIEGGSAIYQNELNQNNYIKISLTGTISNYDAIGSKIYLYDKNKKLLGYQELISGSGYSSKNSSVLHFGSGNEKELDVFIVFPSGESKSINNVKPGSYLKVKEEGNIFFTYWTGALFYNYELRNELIKTIIPMILILLSFYISGKKYYESLLIKISSHLLVLIVFLLINSYYIYEIGVYPILVPYLSCISMLLLYHFYFLNILMKNKIRFENEKIRSKIARDLHDDLASSLSSAAIYSEIIKNSEDKDISLITKISQIIQQASTSLTDIIWFSATDNDYCHNLAEKISVMIKDILDGRNQTIKENIELGMKEKKLTELQKRNIYLIFKEAVNNSNKYSGSNSFAYSFQLIDNELIVSFKDDGCGFLGETEEIQGSGNGLKNMKFRADEINATLEIFSNPDWGTKIELQLKLT